MLTLRTEVLKQLQVISLESKKELAYRIAANKIYNKVVGNRQLKQLEIEGFVRGERNGKTVEVALEVLVESLSKQWKDFEDAWEHHRHWKNAPDLMKVKLADLRNNAGCVFLKVIKEEAIV